MTNKKDRIILAIIGFFVFVIPLIFLHYSIKREFEFLEYRVKEDLREKLLDTAEKIGNNLEPYNYLKSEFNKIHLRLFPDAPNEVIDKIPDENFVKTLYKEDTFKKIINLTLERFAPITVIMGTNKIEKVFSYFSPELEKDFKELDNGNYHKNKNQLLEAKTHFDLENIGSIFNSNYYYYPTIKNSNRFNFRINSFNKELLNICYKYISRFIAYNRSSTPLYTDYFQKQVLYNILKFTISKNGIHGFYSVLVPQSHVDPKEILLTALSKADKDIKIDIENNKEISETNEPHENNNGFEFKLNFPTLFVNLVNSFKRLRNIDRTEYLHQQLKLTIDYPKEYTQLKKLKLLTHILSVLVTLFYLLFSIKIITSNSIILKLTKKLTFVLSIIILLPILGIGILSYNLSHNSNNFIDINARKNLNNYLESYSLLDKENFLRRLAFIFEMKQNVKSNYFQTKKRNIFDTSFFPSKYKKSWENIIFNNINEFFVVSEKEDFFYFDKLGNMIASIPKSDKEKLFIKSILLKYLNNLTQSKSKVSSSKETLALFILEQYVNQTLEEKTFSQESIPLRDILSGKVLDTSSYFYATDKNNLKHIIYSKISGRNSRTYDFLKPYFENHVFWYKPQIKNTTRTNLVITLRNNLDDGDQLQLPISSRYDNEFKDLINKMVTYKDSGSEKIIKDNGSIIKEWIYNDNSPFVIFGITETKHKNTISLITSMIFPILITYAIFLLILLNDFISIFINKPLSIYNEGIEKLRNNELGTTIESFSNDEFNNITTAFNEMSIAINQKEQMKRYVSERLIQSVESNDVQEAGDGKQERVTILSSDIRNFTGTSELYEPSEIVEMLNTYFTKMQKAISDNGGIIDKYIGDAIQAVFYDEPDKENKVIRASKAAIGMRKAIKEFNEERKAKGLFTIENGIGIDTDFAITGTIGTSKGRKDFSVNGDVINRAAELEAKTKMTTSKILISKKSLDWIAMQSSTARNDGNNTDDSNTLSLNKVYNTSLVYREFDKDSVELIDVRE